MAIWSHWKRTSFETLVSQMLDLMLVKTGISTPLPLKLVIFGSFGGGHVVRS